ncbi:MAG: hypothetical protein JXA09_17330 [Anaerolineae bacterium]|nr:hypothetical protein [Anaerolineae bacterium]
MPTFQARLIGQPRYLVLPPGGQGALVFDVQNTGTVAWMPGMGLDLPLAGGMPLGAADPQLLESVVPVGGVARWSVPVEAPRAPGIYRTSWQMAHQGQPFGPLLSGAVIVSPHVQGLGVDYAALLSAWIEDLGYQFTLGVRRAWEGATVRLDAWFGEGPAGLGDDLDRLWGELRQGLQEIDLGARWGSE